MSSKQRLGRCLFLTWSEVDLHCGLWAKSYFGEHAEGESERDEEDFYIAINGLKCEDEKKFRELFDKFDRDGDFDPDEEFATGDNAAVLPKCVALHVLDDVARKSGLRMCGHAVATYIGVYLLENEMEPFW